MTRHRRKHGFPLSSLLPVAAALGGWARFGEPFHGAGLIVLLSASLIVSMAIPGILLSLASLPRLLVPARTRAWWRRGKPREDQKSSYIPVHLRRAVYAADRYRCCWCRAMEDLQIDHVRPWAAGGLAVLWNLSVLCGTCNKIKSDYWPGRCYHPFEGLENHHEAADILRFERRHRWSPARWVRAGWSLAA